MSSSDKAKIFLLGVGAQKCGTTWLFEYLNDHPNTEMGFTKEFHIFDALFVPECRQFLTDTVSEAVKRLQSGSFPSAPATSVFKRLDFLQDIDSYFGYFWSLVYGKEKAVLTGEITPSYSALPASALGLIKRKLDERRFQGKVVFLMRDPVERCISSVRMELQRNSNQPISKQAEEDKLRSVYCSREFEIRTRYDLTIGNIETVFSRCDIHYEFYETLFAPHSIERLCEFLSIPFAAPMFGRATNVSRSGNSIDIRLRRDIFQYYRPVYAFVSDRFGASLVDHIWQKY